MVEKIELKSPIMENYKGDTFVICSTIEQAKEFRRARIEPNIKKQIDALREE